MTPLTAALLLENCIFEAAQSQLSGDEAGDERSVRSVVTKWLVQAASESRRHNFSSKSHSSCNLPTSTKVSLPNFYDINMSRSLFLSALLTLSFANEQPVSGPSRPAQVSTSSTI